MKLRQLVLATTLVAASTSVFMAGSALAQAKEDFQLVRQGKPPRHAHYVDTTPPHAIQGFRGKRLPPDVG